MVRHYVRVETRVKNKRWSQLFNPKRPSITPQEIKEIRTKLKMTKRDLGRRLGVYPSGYHWKSVRDWENGRNRPGPAVEKLLYYLAGKIDRI